MYVAFIKTKEELEADSGILIGNHSHKHKRFSNSIRREMVGKVYTLDSNPTEKILTLTTNQEGDRAWGVLPWMCSKILPEDEARRDYPECFI